MNNSTKYKNMIDRMVHYLIENIDKLEQKFEYGEVLTGLGSVVDISDSTEILKDLLVNEQKKIYHVLESMKKFGNKRNDIFQLNWCSQSLVMVYKMSIRYPNIINHTNLLTELIIDITNMYDDIFNSNYLAVAFEALTGLYSIHQNKKISNRIVTLFVLLGNRINEQGLVNFKDGSARIDITGHFLNGIDHILRYNIIIEQKGGWNNRSYAINKNKYIDLIKYQNKMS